jgi:hypothetical protein
MVVASGVLLFILLYIHNQSIVCTMYKGHGPLSLNHDIGPTEGTSSFTYAFILSLTLLIDINLLYILHKYIILGLNRYIGGTEVMDLLYIFTDLQSEQCSLIQL